MLPLIKSAIAIMRSIWATFTISLQVLINAARGKLNRQKVDQLTRKWSNKLLQIVGLNYQVAGQAFTHYPANRCIILMCNHSSLYDIPLAISALPGSIRMLAKRELFKVPIWGQAMRAAEFLSIDRKNREQAIKDLQAARAKMQDGIVLWIAPEGTRSKDGTLLPFKKGGFILAIQTGAIIIPVGIRGAAEVLAARTLALNFNQHVDIHLGEPIDAAEYTLETKDQLMTRVRDSLSKLVSKADTPNL